MKRRSFLGTIGAAIAGVVTASRSLFSMGLSNEAKPLDMGLSNQAPPPVGTDLDAAIAACRAQLARSARVRMSKRIMILPPFRATFEWPLRKIDWRGYQRA